MHCLYPPVEQHQHLQQRKPHSLHEWAASTPAVWPAQSWRDPAASCTSSQATMRTVFEIIHWAVSQMPMRWEPGLLSICRQEMVPDYVGWQRLYTSALQRVQENDRNYWMLFEKMCKVSSSRQHASMPDGPAAPSLCKACMQHCGSLSCKRHQIVQDEFWVKSYPSEECNRQVVREVFFSQESHEHCMSLH